MPHDRSVTLRAELAVVGRIGRITFNFIDDPVVGHMDHAATGMQTHLACRPDPFAGFQ